MKKITILVVEFAFILSLVIIIVTALIGGFSFALGPLTVRSHHFTIPAIVLISTLLLRRFLVGSFSEAFHLPTLARRIEDKMSLLSDRFALRVVESRQFRRRGIMTLFIFLFGMGIIAASNPLKRGLTGYYYDNAEWAGSPVMIIQEPFSGLDRMKPANPFVTEHYSIEWKGTILISEPGEYEFTTVSDDDSELYINNQLIVDNRGQYGYQERRGVINLEKGFYPIRVRYMQKTEFAELKIFMSRPGKRTGQAGKPLSDVPLLIEEPSKKTFFIGRCLEILLSMFKFMGFVGGSCIILIGLKGRHILFHSSQNAFVSAVIFLTVFISHFFWSDIITSFDSIWSIPTALSIIKEGNTHLDEYERMLKKHDYYYIERIDNHFYTKFPIGTSLLSVPFVFIIDKVLDVGIFLDLETYINQRIPEGIETFIASIFVALAAIVIFLISDLLVDNLKYSLLLVFIFAFCTSAWSTASRALWQHGPSILLLAAALYIILLVRYRPRSDPRIMQFVSIPLAFSYVVRPTNSIPILIFTVYVLLQHRKQFLPYCCWSLIVAVPFLLYNLHIYQTILSPYYLPNRIGSNPHFWKALAGNLISPARGLFIFSPVLLFSLYGIFLKIRTKQMDTLDYSILLIIVLHWVLISSFPVWWGGHSYGSRFFSDMLPYFLYFLVTALKNVSGLQGIKKQCVVFVLYCSIVMSFFIHYRGATTWEVYSWNNYPLSVEFKLWNWHDIQFLQGIK